MNFKTLLSSTIILFVMMNACNSAPQETNSVAADPSSSTDLSKGQSAIVDDASQKDVVKVASGSKDHTTLVKAIVAADLVNALSNAGPFTVFAPTNEAFNKLPAGTVEGLLKPDQKEALQNILQYHVSVGVFKPEMLKDGQMIGQVNGDKITISIKDGKLMVNGTANIIATIPASNGIIHVIDGVLLLPKQ